MIGRTPHDWSVLTLSMFLALPWTGAFPVAAQDVRDWDCAERLNGLLGHWEVVATTFGEVTNPAPRFVAEATADGRAVHSIFTQDLGATRYEAVALWACSAEHDEVRVFEVNTLGFVEMYVGNFDEAGVLRAELHDDKGRLRQRRTLRWVLPDTLDMSGSSQADGGEELRVTMVRLPRE